ncbi:phasin family protein [Phreatobacter stygius]|uniref:Phasin domain-containing protein n=1 Tax=Phreatobacter stygius TaxID=1940610 RepID=A0A4D7AZW4_9HYPH|nr:phasin family protein [Phreatobacter stygius]QCI66944.1 hypothetical protein E8M01_23485 [Phreatobacter stygius]
MDDVMKNPMELWKASLAAAAKTNRLALDNLQKASALQMDAFNGYMELGFTRLKAAADINDARDLLAFQSDQIGATFSLCQKLIGDGKALADLGTGCVAECSKLAEGVVGRPAKRRADKASPQAA